MYRWNPDETDHTKMLRTQQLTFNTRQLGHRPNILTNKFRQAFIVIICYYYIVIIFLACICDECEVTMGFFSLFTTAIIL